MILKGDVFHFFHFNFKGLVLYRIPFFLSIILAVSVVLFVFLFDSNLKIEKEQTNSNFIEEKRSSIFAKMGFILLPLKKKAPSLILRSLDAKSYGLEEFSGKVLLLNFWAIWCPPCIREMPSMQTAYEKFKGKGLEVLAISLDSNNFVKIKEFVQELKLTFPIAYDPKDDAKFKYEVRSIPTTFIIDRKGYLVAYSKGPREWDSEIALNLIKYLLSK